MVRVVRPIFALTIGEPSAIESRHAFTLLCSQLRYFHLAQTWQDMNVDH